MIVMDEPTAALTQKEIRSLFHVIENLKRAGIATLFVSHKLDEVQEIADRVIVLRNGEVVLDRKGPAMDRLIIVEAVTGHSAERQSAGGRTAVSGCASSAPGREALPGWALQRHLV